MSDPTAPVEGTPATSSTPESTPAADPWAPVSDRVGELAGTVGELQSSFQQFMQAQQPPPPEPVDPWASLIGPPEEAPQYFDQFGQPVELPAQQPGLDMGALQQAVTAQLQQAQAPLQQRIQAFEAQQAAQQLYAEIPQLAEVPEGHPDYATHQAARQQTAQAVQASVSHLPPQIAQQLMDDPRYVATVFKAAEADKRSQAQVPASEQVPSLEAAGGAVPGGNGEPPSYIQSAHNGAWTGLPPGLR